VTSLVIASVSSAAGMSRRTPPPARGTGSRGGAVARPACLSASMARNASASAG
jgi:hypothetical protein